MKATTTCPACSGTGHRPCAECHGTGRVEFNPWEVPLRRGDCQRCGGSGRDPAPDPTCRGRGEIDAGKAEH